MVNKRNRIILLLTIVMVSLLIANYYSYRSNRNDFISRPFSQAKSDIVPVKDIIHGEWDAVCFITELMSVEDVLDKASGSDFVFNPSGNYSRDLIYDGETGFVTISFKRKDYSIFIIDEKNRNAIVGSDDSNNGCIPFKEAKLKKSDISDDAWTYLKMTR